MLLIQLAHFVKIRPELFVTGSRHRATLDRMFSRLQLGYQPMLLTSVAHFVKIRPELFVTGSRHRATLDRMFSRLQVSA
uniref:SFRICE_033785 n=1 Tax=Spodoptera frugiperda TaxID=7108 RepID=A0A2H1X0D7_SPOFR